MAKYLFVYRGGVHPETKEEVKQVMDAWGAWFNSMGGDVVDGGNPVGISTTVNSDGAVVNNGGANPASGYSLIEASDVDETRSQRQCTVRYWRRAGRWNWPWHSICRTHPSGRIDAFRR